METSLADIKKQYEKLKNLMGDEEAFDLSDEDALRCQDALSLLKSRNYILDASTLCEKRYIKAAEWDWLDEMIKESNRMSRREWTIAIVSAVIGAAIGLIPTIIGALC